MELARDDDLAIGLLTTPYSYLLEDGVRSSVLFADTGIRTQYRVGGSIKNVNSINYVVHSNN